MAYLAPLGTSAALPVPLTSSKPSRRRPRALLLSTASPPSPPAFPLGWVDSHSSPGPSYHPLPSWTNLLALVLRPDHPTPASFSTPPPLTVLLPPSLVPQPRIGLEGHRSTPNQSLRPSSIRDTTNNNNKAEEGSGVRPRRSPPPLHALLSATPETEERCRVRMVGRWGARRGPGAEEPVIGRVRERAGWGPADPED